jgi:hypothetical protein
VSAAVSFVEIVHVVLPRSNVDGVIGMLTAYFDDSGTHGDSDVVVIGGLIGAEKHWSPFEIEWKAKLANPLPGKPPLRRFHMAPCMARGGDFAGYSEGERDAVIHDFRQIILDADLTGFSYAVSLKDWDTIIGTRSFRGLKDPEFFCMSNAITQSAKIARDYTTDKQISLIFDDRPDRREANEHIFSMYHHGHNLNVGREEIVGISFLSSEKIVALQAADMVAWETYDHAKKWLREGAEVPTRPHLTPLAKSGRFIAHIAGPRAIQDLSVWLEKIQDK